MPWEEKLKEVLKRNGSERHTGREEMRKGRENERDRVMESRELRAGQWEKQHRQNFKLCLWHCSHTLTSTFLAWEYLKACQTLFRAVVIHFGAVR